jgi:class 3 adenylate cyclase
MESAGSARVERRLAAILAADVAGYSRLIEADEEDTLARLKALRAELIDPKIAEHKGCIVKTTGDGLLVDFASVGRRPDTKSSRCSGFRRKLASGITSEVIPRSLVMTCLASSTRPI